MLRLAAKDQYGTVPASLELRKLDSCGILKICDIPLAPDFFRFPCSPHVGHATKLDRASLHNPNEDVFSMFQAGNSNSAQILPGTGWRK
jgi:hypothetical protein